MGRVMRWAAAAVVGAFVMTGAACTDEPTQPSDLSGTTTSLDSSGTSEAASSSEPPASASSSYSAEEQAVVDQYKGYYNAFYQLSAPSDDQVRAAFQPFAEPGVVENLVVVFQKLTAEDKAPSGGIEFGPLDIVVNGQSVTVVECRDGTSERIVRVSNGELLAQGEPGTKIESELRLDPAGSWLIHSTVPEKAAC